MTALIKNMSETWLWRPSGDSHIRMCHARVPHRELIDVSRETNVGRIYPDNGCRQPATLSRSPVPVHQEESVLPRHH